MVMITMSFVMMAQLKKCAYNFVDCILIIIARQNKRFYFKGH